MLIFTPDGRFTQIHVASDVPKIASGNRLTGTAEEYAAINRRSLSVFGTYTVDEEKKTVTYKIVSSTFPNWEGEAQTRTIDRADRRRVRQHQPERGGRARQRVELLQAREVANDRSSSRGRPKRRQPGIDSHGWSLESRVSMVMDSGTRFARSGMTARYIARCGTFCRNSASSFA